MSKNRRIIIIIVCAVLVLGVIAYRFISRRGNDAPEQPKVLPSATPAVALKIDPNAGTRVTPTPAPTDPGIAIPGWGGINLPAFADEAYVELYNPEANTDWYYLTFELVLAAEDKEETVFKTGLIPPGMYCNKVSLQRQLEPGTYNGIMKVQPYRISNTTPTNNAVYEIKINVESP